MSVDPSFGINVGLLTYRGITIIPCYGPVVVVATSIRISFIMHNMLSRE